ncbi:hypothetical protein [Blastopirellula marina]|uniref:Glycosyl hydrolases family 2 sugar binding domain-containing protein n=1 Tax=Blastopirellula marina TaxID=124 RepID=A0A2S8F852_9BACT|nr:hypothetical protein [Blastopirellula marina]PQO28310.1 hypothetical protein C5Y98_25790 [Blastopirellula marina]PTL41850.1 hypothetical protein C5Y97_25805 [Blastopirellula marina]
MSNHHTIRLNGPWEMITALPDEPQRVKLPKGWPEIISAAKQGPVLLQRWFHRPTGIDDGSQVELVLIGLPFSGSVSVNDQSLGSFAPFQTHARSVGAHLTERCCLTLSVERLGELEDSIPIPQISLAILPAS